MKKSKLDVALDKISKYKNRKWKNKFICKTFGICAGEVITPESFVKAIVKVMELSK